VITDEEMGMRRALVPLLIGLIALTTACGSGSGSKSSKTEHPKRLQGLVKTPAPQVGTLSLPNASNGDQEFAFKAPPGQILLVYFGYTSCPDICPGTLAGLKLAIRRLGTDADKVTVAMATVDPERDTGPVLVEYLGRFFKQKPAQALRTGDAARLQTVADGFGVQYEVQKSADGKVEVGHTALVFAVNDQGQIVDAWPFGMDDHSITDDLRILLHREATSA
jgi:cytochrome oxidase Cu insertion factor (SCO1/SenC/PrrC family)